MSKHSTPVAVSVSLVLVSFAAVVAAFRMRVDIPNKWLLGFFQFLIAIGGVSVIVAAFGLAHWVYNSALERIVNLERSHGEVLRRLKRKTPPWIVATIYVAEVYLVFADKVFGDDVGTTIAATLLLIAWFHFANHFLQSESPKVRKSVGLPLWLVGIVFLPVSAVAYRGSVGEAWSAVNALPWYTIVFIVLGVVYIVWMPFGIALQDESQ